MIEYIEHDTFGSVRISRRKGSRSIRIGISQNGQVRLSIPYRVSLADGLRFLEEKRAWILKHKSEPIHLEEGARIGKAHTLHVEAASGTTSRTRIDQSTITVTIPEDYSADQVQAKLESATKKMLLAQAKNLLPQRVTQYASQHQYSVASVSVKALQSRWGSCSSRNDIILNIYLMQLPWDLIDYVIFHELTHTIHHNHSDKFWSTLAIHVPDYKTKRSNLKKIPTSVFDMRYIENFMS